MIDDIKILHGIIPALVTPRTADGDVDTGTLTGLVAHLLESGVNGIFAASSTGEAPLLSRAQRRVLIETVVAAVDGGVPVLAGAGATSTAESIALAREAEGLGATHLSILPSHFVPVTQDELYGYFAAVADSVEIPTVLYNYPARTSGQHIEHETAARLARDHNVIGLKDSSGDITNMAGYLEACGDGFMLFSGPESLIYPCLAMGGVGAICAGANVYPRKMAALYAAAIDGDHATARRLQRAIQPLRRWGRVGTFPAGVKTAMALMGHPVGDPFPPAMPLAGSDLDTIRRIIHEIGPDQA